MSALSCREIDRWGSPASGTVLLMSDRGELRPAGGASEDCPKSALRHAPRGSAHNPARINPPVVADIARA